jgi:stage II sporulation protein D
MNSHSRRNSGISWLLVLAIASAAVGQASGPKSTPQPGATLRVGLWSLWHDKQIAIAPAPEGRVSLRTCESCAATPLSGATQIHAVGGHLVFGDTRQAAALWLTGRFTLAGHGESLDVANPLHIAARNGELVLSVTLPTESYVERVVTSEGSAADSPESLKALAIVVRSFALHEAHGHTEYDLCDSTHCQLLHWGGNPARRAAAHAATLATAGETLWFHGARAEAWFHQNCGGRTASPAELWPGRKQMPWLASRTDSYCTASGARAWSANLSLSELTAALAADGLVRPGWKSLTVARRGESGRAVTLRADSTEFSAEAFRLAVGRSLGWNRILSTWFEVTRQGDRFLFHGRGSGHGVGLCQAGAAAMAAEGQDSSKILAQYFPGAAVADEASGLSWQSVRGQGFVLETLDPADTAYLPALGRALAEAESRSGLTRAGFYTIRSFRSTPAFRDATLAPGWVAAFTEGDWIGVQPLRTLAGRKMLVPVLRHEFLHALVESQAAAHAPLWLREGLVEIWGQAGMSAPQPVGPAPTMQPGEVDHALAHAATETQSAAAHRAAGWYAARLLSRFGREQVLAWLRSGLPASALATLR